MFDGHSRFLLVEGEGRVRRLLASMLHGSGARTVHNAPDGAAAKEMLLTRAVDFVVCDWGAPETSGVEFLRSVRSFPVTRYLPFLLMSRTGQLQEEDFAAAKDYDVDGHLFKPIAQDDLRDKVRRTVDHHNSMTATYTHLARAGAFVDIGAFDEARAELQAAQAARDDSPRVWSESGLLLAEMKQPQEAKRCHQRSIELDRTYTRAYDSLGRLLQQEGRHDLAVRFYSRSAQISPRNRERQFILGEALLAKGDAEGAKAAVRRAVEGLVPEAARSAAAAEFFLSHGRADIAEEQYAFALEADPENVHYFNRLGIAFRRQKKFKEAVENYRKALVVAPDNPVIYYNMALALAEAGQRGEAAGALRSALAIDPGFEAAESLLKKIQPRQAPTNGA